MSRSTQHAYEVVEVNNEGGAFLDPPKIGGHLVDKNHVRKHHEPYREWMFMPMSGKVGEVRASSIVGKHIGEYEKVKHLLVAKATA